MISERNQIPDLHKIRSERVLKAMRNNQRRHKLVLRVMKTAVRSADPIDVDQAAGFWLKARLERRQLA